MRHQNGRKQRIPLLITVITALCIAGVAWTQDDVVFHSAVSLVRVDAEVSDASGHILTDLKKNDFRITEDGKEQSIVNFSFEEEPLDVILLFDVGGNMRSKLLNVVRAVELGFHELREGDRGCVMAFSFNAVELQPFTTDFGAVNQAILLGVLKQRFGGASKLVEAADEAALRFRAEPNTQRRRAILIVSDKTASRQPDQNAAMRDLWQSNAVLSELILDRTPQHTDAVVEKTGGATITAGSDPGAAFQESLRRLRRRCTLYYTLPPGTAGSERNIRVELTGDAARRFPGSRVSARTGYIAQTPRQ